MHKFFCSYNRLCERYELTKSQSVFSQKVNIQAESILIDTIKKDMQTLYDLIALLKDSEEDEQRLNICDETELLISNLFYSLFASPLELANFSRELKGDELKQAQYLISNIEKAINIPEYNRLIIIIKNNINFLLS